MLNFGKHLQLQNSAQISYTLIRVPAAGLMERATRPSQKNLRKYYALIKFQTLYSNYYTL